MNKVKSYINEKYKISEVWFLCFGESVPLGKCFCPFHSNTKTPSAKIYEDSGVLKCFSVCQRSYTSYDLLKKFRPDIIENEKKSTIFENKQTVNKSNFRYINVKVLISQGLSNVEIYKNIKDQYV
jgi:hypothetical protein